MARKRRQEGAVPWLFKRIAGGFWWHVMHPQSLIVVALVSVMLWGLWTQARYAEAFHVAHLQLPAEMDFQIRKPVIGRNIWEVDLNDLASQLKQQQSWLKDVRVVRALPDTIRVEAIRRIPVAQIRLSEWHAVDNEGYILPQAVDEDEAGHLVKVEGFNRNGVALTAEKINSHPDLQRALRILAALRQFPMLQEYRLTHLNVGNPHQLSFHLDDEIEIRCGSEADLPTHLQRLRIALELLKREGVEARYIDVRFPEPVFGPKV